MPELCLGCMKEYANGTVCPYCGFSNESEQNMPFLPLGTILKDRYIVGRLLHSNAQGAEYLGYDDELKSAVIIREFLPEGICGRSRSAGVNVIVRQETRELYASLLKSFLQYFRTIARLRDLNTITSIYDIFNDNNTAYTIEDYEELLTFREYIERSGGHLEWNVARPLFMPLISTIETIHKNGILHLGLSPDGLYVTESGKLLLKDFMIPQLRHANGSIAPALITGCSAPEQYNQGSELTRKTDVYGLTAVMFFALTGNLPNSYEKRKADSRLLISTNVVKRLPPYVVTALANGLQFSISKRTESVDMLRTQLSSAPTVKAIREEINTEARINKASSKSRTTGKKNTPAFVWGIVSFTCSFLLLALTATLWISLSNPFDKWFSSNVTTSISADSDDELLTNTGETMKTPDFSGISYDKLLDDDSKDVKYNIVRSLDGKFSDTAPQDTVISQFPAAGEEVPVGTTVIVTLSDGTEERELPDISGKKLSEVAELLAAERFITQIKTEYNSDVAAGSVVGYYKDGTKNYKAGDKLPCSSWVTIVVSRGEDPSSTSSADEN